MKEGSIVSSTDVVPSIETEEEKNENEDTNESQEEGKSEDEIRTLLQCEDDTHTNEKTNVELKSHDSNPPADSDAPQSELEELGAKCKWMEIQLKKANDEIDTLKCKTSDQVLAYPLSMIHLPPAAVACTLERRRSRNGHR